MFVTREHEGRLQHPRGRSALDGAVERFEAALPKRITLEQGFDQSRQRGLAPRTASTWTSRIAIALVMLTLLPLGWRAAGIVMVSIPLSLAFGITVLYFLGYSLNQLSIAGFVVALGLLVDDSIVAVENISRHLRMGYTRVQAAIAGTQQIFVAVARLHRDADLRLPAADGAARQRRQVHPRAADGRGRARSSARC